MNLQLFWPISIIYIYTGLLSTGNFTEPEIIQKNNLKFAWKEIQIFKQQFSNNFLWVTSVYFMFFLLLTLCLDLFITTSKLSLKSFLFFKLILKTLLSEHNDLKLERTLLFRKSRSFITFLITVIEQKT